MRLCATQNRKGNVARFSLNRRWTFILALVLGLATSAFGYRIALAGGSPGSGKVQDPSVPLPGDGSGDPDVPIGPVRSTRPGKLVRGGSDLGGRTVGDGRFPGGVQVWRLRVALQGLRSFYVRF